MLQSHDGFAAAFGPLSVSRDHKHVGSFWPSYLWIGLWLMVDDGLPPDPYARTVRLPVRIVDGRPAFFYGDGKLPKLKEGTVGDLILPAYAVLDERARDDLELEVEEQALPRGTRLLARVTRPAGEDGVVVLRADQVEDERPGAFVEIVLLEPLWIRIRSTKRACLPACRCAVPALDFEVNSINEAYTRISEAYEPHRASHSGNVFQRVYHEVVTGSGVTLWRPLDSLRRPLEATVERVVFRRKE